MNQKTVEAINTWIATDLPLGIKADMSPALIDALINRLEPPPSVTEPVKVKPKKAKKKTKPSNFFAKVAKKKR